MPVVGGACRLTFAVTAAGCPAFAAGSFSGPGFKGFRAVEVRNGVVECSPIGETAEMADDSSSGGDEEMSGEEESDPVTFLWKELDETAQGRQTKRELTEQFDRIREALIPQLQPFNAMFEDLQKTLAVSVPVIDTSKLVKNWPVGGVDTSKFVSGGTVELSDVSE